MNVRTVIRTGLLSVSLLAGGLLAANAQNPNPDPTLTEVFATDTLANPRNSLGTSAYVNGAGLGVGWDATSTLFVNSTTQATAQSVFNSLVYRGTTVNPGDFFQIGVHATAFEAAGNPQTLYASIYTLAGDPNGSVVPLGAPVIRNIPIAIASSATKGNSADQIFFSNKITLPTGLVNGQQYVLAFSPRDVTATGSTPADYLTVERIAYTKTGQATGDQAIFANSYTIDNNSGDTGGAWNQHLTASNSTIAYRFLSGSAPVPEPMSAVCLGSLIGMFAWSRNRRRKMSPAC